MQHDYDEYYDTKVSRPFHKSKFGYITGTIFIFLGVISIVITIVDMYKGVYNQNRSQPNNQFVFTWDENPFWPSYGKGFWVGLLFWTTGIIGIVASCENTLTSIYAYSIMSAASGIFGIFMMISAIIPVERFAGIGTNNLAQFENETLSLNAILMALGALGFINGIITCVLSAILVGCYENRRNFGLGDMLIKTDMTNIY